MNSRFWRCLHRRHRHGRDHHEPVHAFEATRALAEMRPTPVRIAAARPTARRAYTPFSKAKEPLRFGWDRAPRRRRPGPAPAAADPPGDAAVVGPVHSQAPNADALTHLVEHRHAIAQGGRLGASRGHGPRPTHFEPEQADGARHLFGFTPLRCASARQPGQTRSTARPHCQPLLASAGA